MEKSDRFSGGTLLRARPCTGMKTERNTAHLATKTAKLQCEVARMFISELSQRRCSILQEKSKRNQVNSRRKRSTMSLNSGSDDFICVLTLCRWKSNSLLI